MPLYVYTCPDCEIEVEEMRPMSQADDRLACPLCAGPCTRALTTFTIGSGRREVSPVSSAPARTHAAGCLCCAPRRRP